MDGNHPQAPKPEVQGDREPPPAIDLRDGSLADIDWKDVDLSGANLSGADLSGADLRGANLSGAIFVGVNLDGANLDGVDFRKAKLTEPDLARVRGANSSNSEVGRLVDDPDQVIAVRSSTGADGGMAIVDEAAQRLWLPVLGPSSMWLYRTLLSSADSGDEVTPSVLHGLHRFGPHSLPGHLERLRRFGAVTVEADALVVHRSLPRLSAKQLARVPSVLTGRYETAGVGPATGEPPAGRVSRDGDPR